MSKEQERPDGICQRCGQPVFPYGYTGGLPPNEGRFTCLGCQTPEELARIGEHERTLARPPRGATKPSNVTPFT